MGLSDDITGIAAAAQAYALPGEQVVAVLPAEPAAERVYLCAFESGDGAQSWIVLDDRGAAVTTRKVVRDAASIAALCEIAEETLEEPAGLRVASPGYLDGIGPQNGVASTLQGALSAVEELAKDVESNYKVELK